MDAVWIYMDIWMLPYEVAKAPHTNCYSQETI